VSWSSWRGFCSKAYKSLSQHADVLRECDKLEPMVKRVHGTVSTEMARLLGRRADALLQLNRFPQARTAALESLRITKLVSGRGNDYAYGLQSLTLVCFKEGDFDAALNYIQEARSLVSAENFGLLANVLNLESLLLMKLERYQEALIVREKETELSLRIKGPNHHEYATSLNNTAQLYAELKQMQSAVDLTSKAVAIYKKTFGPSHPHTQNAQNRLAIYQKALIDPDLKNQFASTKNRMCNVDGCNTVEENMNRCSKCLSFYLCEEHKDKINEHVAVCPKFPDVLPDEKKLTKIVKCRRCRKESKLMKCAVCESVWYCGATCQKEDWKRHKLFCGKK
jgi:tetratricopeptide (TPR) repeat protein